MLEKKKISSLNFINLFYMCGLNNKMMNVFEKVKKKFKMRKKNIDLIDDDVFHISTAYLFLSILFLFFFSLFF